MYQITKFFFIALLSSFFTSHVFSKEMNKTSKSVYGDDNRIEISEILSSQIQNLSHSIAAQIPYSSILEKDDHFEFNGQTLGEKYLLCNGEKFQNQKVLARCTGFLIGNDLLVSAGHCVNSLSDCINNAWVFNFQLTQSDLSQFSKENVYHCKKVLSKALFESEDYSVIQLDRPVRSGKALKFRTQGRIETGTPVFVMGHPSGLPAKMADNAKVFINDNPEFFVTDLDSFGGNSGSPVFNQKTLEVEGILVRGERDYIFDLEEQCYKVNHCPEFPLQCTQEELSCRGESVSRIGRLNLPMLFIQLGRFDLFSNGN